MPAPPALNAGQEGISRWLRVSTEAFSLFGQFTTAGPGDATTNSIGCHRMRSWSGDAGPGEKGGKVKTVISLGLSVSKI